MRLFKKVAIVGTGLIGGSLGLAIKKKKIAAEVIGVSRKRSSISLAKKRGAIDKGSQDISIVRDADLLILATPVDAIIKLAPKLARLIQPGCLVIDVGSTKQKIVAKLEKIFPKYVGTHPLSGSEKRSITHAKVDLFKDSLCLLTPTHKTNKTALKKIEKFWLALGAKVILLSPARHDKILSFTSHLPHAIAFSLISTVPGQHLKFASGGLKDTTRIASSDVGLWANIFLTNRENIIQAIESFQSQLRHLKSAIKKNDKVLLKRILNAAKAKREILK